MFIRLQRSLNKITYEKHSSVNVKLLVRVSYYSTAPLQFNYTSRPHWLSLPSHIGFSFVNHPLAPPLYPEGFSRSHSPGQFTLLAYTRVCPFSSRFSASSAVTKQNCAHCLRRLDSFAAGEVSERMLTNLNSELRGEPILGGACVLPRAPRHCACSAGTERGVYFPFLHHCAYAHGGGGGRVLSFCAIALSRRRWKPDSFPGPRNTE